MSNHPTRGLLIAVEGIDAAGKKTQTEQLAQWLNGVRLDFPQYHSHSGRIIKELLKTTPEEGAEQAHATILQALMTVNRYELTSWLTRKLKSGQTVVFDRYYMSGLVYGLSDGLPKKWLVDIHDALPKPDLYIYIDIPVEESFRRRPVREDAYEANENRLKKARMVYNEMWENPVAQRNWAGDSDTQFSFFDGMTSPDTLQAMLRDTVSRMALRILKEKQA